MRHLNYDFGRISDVSLADFGFSALSTALRFLPLGITALIVNIVVPPLLKPVGPKPLLIASWVAAIAGIVLLSLMYTGDDYWRLCLPGMILYTAGIATVYYLGNVLVVATAATEEQGTISGVYNVSGVTVDLRRLKPANNIRCF